MDTDARLVPLEGSFNFRDLGGYPAPDGRTTRWGRLYRSRRPARTDRPTTWSDCVSWACAPWSTCGPSASWPAPAGVRSEPEEVAFHHLAVVQGGRPGRRHAGGAADGESVAAPAAAGDDLAERYLWYLEVGRASLVTALTLLGGDEHYPLVFHCAAGKDRTGRAGRPGPRDPRRRPAR